MWEERGGRESNRDTGNPEWKGIRGYLENFLASLNEWMREK